MWRYVDRLSKTSSPVRWVNVISRRSARAPLTADSLRALLVALVSLAALGASAHRLHTSLSELAVTVTLAATLPLAGRRRWPLAVLVIVAAAEALYLATSPLGETFTGLGLAVALYTAASRTERRLSLRLAAAVVAVNGLVLLVAVALGRPGSGPSLVLMTVLAVGSWSLGDNVRTRRAYLAGLEERARRLEQEREENARRAVEEERGRIARELHDVVAHHVSAVVVQAGAAAEIVTRDPERAGEALRFIQEASRQALVEMRVLLNVLRGDDDGRAERGPQPRLTEVAHLIGQSRAAGLPVTLQVEGAVRLLPEALDLSAYRIVQEALTNSLTHAGPAPTQVWVRYAPEALELEIRDEGVGPFQTPIGTGGRGLVGMRERVALFGGELSAGPVPAPERGFRVRARFPLGGRAP